MPTRLFRNRWPQSQGAILIAASLLVANVSIAATDGEPIRFEHEVRPILISRCSECHGTENAEAGLVLTSRDALLDGGDSGPAIIRGSAEQSLLFQKISDGEMPPEDPLARNQIDVIRRWLDEGALVDGESAGSNAATADPFLESEVLVKVFFTHCISCHGKSRQEAGLDLRSREGMLRGGKSGPALIPGDPEESLVYRRIHADEMPPKISVLGDDNYVRRVNPDELSLLAQWIKSGAPASPAASDATADVQRSTGEHWSLRPPERIAPPPTTHPHQVLAPIDAFILSKLETRKLDISADASKLELLRRAHFDLVGLPPSPEEIDAFLQDSRSDSYERLIDRLLESPRYGERWAQFWLDGAGYADSHGKIDRDQFRPYMWRYRDYVIRSLNADKPYDQFLCEQLAGDELISEKGDSMPPSGQIEALIATGFLLTASDATDEAAFNFVPNRMGVIAEQLDVVSTSVMAMTMECARCHSHKFDPITQRDYYRWSAVFQTALDPYDWRIVSQKLYPKQIPLDRSHQRYIYHPADAEPEELVRFNQPLRERIAAIERQLQAQVAGSCVEASDGEDIASTSTSPVSLPSALSGQVPANVADGKGDAANSTPRSTNAAAHQSPQRDAELESARAELAALRAELIEPVAIHGLQDLGGAPTPVYQLRRGEPQSPGYRVEAGVPGAFEEQIDGYLPAKVGGKSSGYRLGFARWLTQPRHPLTARVIVNRLWQQHFGVGLVPTPANFGAKGLRPTHPELLDWLATELVQSGWSLKSIHRQIMTSSTYRQTSLADQRRLELDQDNSLYSRFPLRRLDAEGLRDAMLMVSGQLDLTPFGPPDKVARSPLGEVVPAQSTGSQRRSIYLAKMRSKPVTFLAQFDGADMTPNCLERTRSTVPTQALELLHGEFTERCAAGLAKASIEGSDAQDEARLTRIYLRLYGRRPTAIEVKESQAAIEQMRSAWTEELQKRPGDAHEAETLAWQSFCSVAFNSPEFLYID